MVAMIRKEFATGLGWAAYNWTRDQYIALMENQEGYMHCLRAWHKETAYMTVEEISIVYDEGKIPPRFFKAFQDFEMEKYNIHIVNHSQFRKE